MMKGFICEIRKSTFRKTGVDLADYDEMQPDSKRYLRKWGLQAKSIIFNEVNQSLNYKIMIPGYCRLEQKL